MDADDEIISIKDSESASSFATLIENDTTFKNEEKPTNQKQVCELYLNHFKEGVTPDIAKKLYVRGLKEKQADSPTIVFEKRDSRNQQPENMNDKKDNNLGESSRKRKGTFDVPVLEKMKCDQNHNVKSEIMERRKTLYISPNTESNRLAKRSNTTHRDAGLKKTQVSTSNQHVNPATPTASNKSGLNLSPPSSSTHLAMQRPSSSNHPSFTTPKRSSSSQKQSSSSLKRPSSSHEQPSISPKRPSISHERPSISHERPSISHERPSISHERPSTSHELPSTSRHKKSSNSHKKSSNSHKKSSNSHKKSSNSHKKSSNSHNQSLTLSKGGEARCSSDSSHRSKQHESPPKSDAMKKEVNEMSSPESSFPHHVLEAARNINISKREIDKINFSIRNVCENSSLQEIDMFSGEHITAPVSKIKTMWSPETQIKRIKLSPDHDDTNNNQNNASEKVGGIKPTSTSNNKPTTKHTDANNNRHGSNQAVAKNRTMSTSSNEIGNPKTTSNPADVKNNRQAVGKHRTTSTSNGEIGKSRTTSNHDDAIDRRHNSNQAIAKNKTTSTSNSEIGKPKTTSNHDDASNRRHNRNEAVGKNKTTSTSNNNSKINFKEPKSVSKTFTSKRPINHDDVRELLTILSGDGEGEGEGEGHSTNSTMNQIISCAEESNTVSPNKSVNIGKEKKSQIICKFDYTAPEKLPKLMLNQLSVSKKKQIIHDRDGSYAVRFKDDLGCIIKKLGNEERKTGNVIRASEEQVDCAQPIVLQRIHTTRDFTCQAFPQTRNFTCQTDPDDTINRLSEEHAVTIKKMEKYITKQASTLGEKDEQIKKQVSTIEEKNEEIKKQAVTIEDFKENNRKQAFTAEKYERTIAEQASNIKDYERKMKENDEKNKNLQNKMNELLQNIKEEAALMLEYERTMEELKQKNEEQAQNETEMIEKIAIQERNLKEQKQQNNEQAKVIVKQQLTIETIEYDRKRLAKSEATCIELMNEHQAFCKENHVEKPRPRKPKQPRRKTTSPKQVIPQIQSPNMACGSQSAQQQYVSETTAIQPQNSQLRLVGIEKLTQNPLGINLSPSAGPSSNLTNSPRLKELLSSPVIMPETPAIATTTTMAVNTSTHNINVPVLITTPNNEWTVEATMPLLQQQMYNGIPLTSPQVNQSATLQNLNYSQAQQQMFIGTPSTSTSTLANPSVVHTSISQQTFPHQFLPRQPQRTLSMSSSRPNTFVTIQPQTTHGNTLYHPDSCSTEDGQISNQSNETAFVDQNRTMPVQQQLGLFSSRLQNRARTQVYNHRSQYQQLQQFQTQSQQQSRVQQLNGNLQDYKSVQQQSNDQQHLSFYCLVCYKTAKLVCKTCRNCCSCSEFCYDLLAVKHKCTQPLMVNIKEILSK